MTSQDDAPVDAAGARHLGRSTAASLSSEVSPYRVDRPAGGAPVLTRHGAPLLTGDTVTAGRFTTDGTRFVTAEIRRRTAPGPLGNLVNPPGRLVVVQVDPSPAAAHRETARVEVGQSPEGVAVTPDGRHAVTVDMRRTYLPDLLSWWPGADRSGLSLVRLDPDGGAALIDEYALDGVLPEDAVFDTAGDTLAVVVFHDRLPEPRIGRVQLWNLVDDRGGARLEPTAVTLTTPRGPHSLAVSP